MQAQAVAEGEHTASQHKAAIRGLKDLFAKGIVTKDPKLRASIWTQDGTLVPPTGGSGEPVVRMARPLPGRKHRTEHVHPTAHLHPASHGTAQNQ